MKAKYYLKKYGIYAVFVISILLISLISILNKNENSYAYDMDINDVTKADVTSITTSEEIEYFYVDIKGAIKKPGVYKVKKGMIVYDVIKKAKGFTKNAYINNVNLSKKLAPEMVIYIYSKSEIKTTTTTTKIIDEVIINDAFFDSSTTAPTTKTTTKKVTTTNNNSSSDAETTTPNSGEDKKDLININTASKEELLSLSGIGSAKADAIITYRASTPFINIEDIMNVSGIGVSLFEQIKDFITV